MEGVWVGCYDKDPTKKYDKDPAKKIGRLQPILVHTVQGKPGFIFGTKLDGDEYVGTGQVTFWFRTGDGTRRDILGGKAQYVDPRSEYIYILSSEIEFFFFLGGGNYLGTYLGM